MSSTLRHERIARGPTPQATLARGVPASRAVEWGRKGSQRGIIMDAVVHLSSAPGTFPEHHDGGRHVKQATGIQEARGETGGTCSSVTATPPR